MANSAIVRSPVHRTTPARALAVMVLIGALAGVGWGWAAHRYSFRAKGERALSLGQAWWLDASKRLSLAAGELKLRMSSPQPTEAAAAPPGATPPGRQPQHARRRGHATAAGTAAPRRAEVGAGGVAWRAARWGMTVDEVLGAFPAEARRAQSRASILSDRLSVRAAIERAAIGAYIYDVSFFFGRDGRLAAVRVRPDTREQSAAHSYRELTDRISGELGPAASHDARSSPSGTWSEVSSWSTPDSRIHLHVAETMPPDARILALDIRTADLHALPRGVELWYEPRR